MYEDRRRGNRGALKWIILIVIILAINFYQSALLLYRTRGC